MKNVQAFIVNIGVPKTLEHLFYHLNDYVGYVIDRILECKQCELEGWTAPKWARAGDIAFFMYVKTGRASLMSLAKRIRENRYLYSQAEYKEAIDFIQHGLALNKNYGGKVFAASCVKGMPYYDDPDAEGDNYWRSRVYADA